MTKKEALEGHIELWDWLTENPTNHSINWFKFKGIGEVNNGCFACEYHIQHVGSYCNRNCIIPIFAKCGGCLDITSPYSLLQMAEDAAEKASYAKIIADSGRKALNLLEKDENS